MGPWARFEVVVSAAVEKAPVGRDALSLVLAKQIRCEGSLCQGAGPAAASRCSVAPTGRAVVELSARVHEE